jgi:hypothetical protein
MMLYAIPTLIAAQAITDGALLLALDEAMMGILCFCLFVEDEESR